MTTPEGHLGSRIHVLTNVTRLQGNPYLDLWGGAVEASGADQRQLSWRSALSLRRGDRNWVHLQWPERSVNAPDRRRAVSGGARLLNALLIARFRGARVLLTAHNVRSHQPRHPDLDRWLWLAVARLVTDLHLMSAAGTEEVLAAHPRLRGAQQHVIPHGDYSALTEPMTKSAARRSVGIPDDPALLVTFGSLRRYKGIGELLTVFRTAGLGDTRLAIAGKPQDDGLAVELTALEATEHGVHTELGFISQDRLTSFITASDGVVLPYRAVLNSGSLLLSLTLSRPALVPSTPTFQELARRVGPGWVHCYEGELTEIDLQAFTASCRTPPQSPPDLTWCSWEVIAGALRELWASEATGR